MRGAGVKEKVAAKLSALSYQLSAISRRLWLKADR
jgi:hypothetical protein